MSHIFSLVLVVFATLGGSDGKTDTCHGECLSLKTDFEHYIASLCFLVKIPDRTQQEHSFTANKTNLETELRVFKKDLISVTGELYLSSLMATYHNRKLN